MWGFEVSDSGSTQNNKLDFIDAGLSFVASLSAGVYTADELAAEVQRAMRAVNTNNQNNTCSFDFSMLKYVLTGTSTFSLKFGTGADIATDCNALLGFNAADRSGSSSYTSDAAVGTSPSSASLWTSAEPLAMNSPVTAQAIGTAALLTQRALSVRQHVSDGMTVESIYVGALRRVRITFRGLLAGEVTKMENLLDWAVQGKRLTWQPDKDSTNALKLVMANPAEIANAYEWLTRPEISYGTLTFYEQLS
jgi:hypothetical protein